MKRNDVQALLVSEDRKFLRLLSRFLNMFGYKARQTTSRDQAARMLDVWPCDLLLVDAGTTASVALEFCSRLAAGHRRGLYVVLLTDPTRLLDFEQVVAAGIDDVLAKPLRFGEVLTRLRGGLRLVHGRRRIAAQGDHDPVTGLPGRAALLEHVATLLPTSVVTCAMIEIDDLDVTEYRHGREAANEFLRATASHLREASTAVDLVASVERGRFALLLNETWETARIDALGPAAADASGENRPPNTLSIGFTTAGPISNRPDPEAAERRDDSGTTRSPASIVVQQAEYALQVAKRSGGACSVRFGEFLDEEQEWKALAEPGRLFERTTTRDVMIPCPVVLRVGDAVSTARHLFEQTRLDAMPVVDQHGKLAGLLTPARVGEALDAGQAEGRSVLQCKAPDVATCTESQSLADLMQKLAAGQNSHVVIVRDGVPIGIVSADDLANLGRPVQHAAYTQETFRHGTDYLLITEAAVEK